MKFYSVVEDFLKPMNLELRKGLDTLVCSKENLRVRGISRVWSKNPKNLAVFKSS